MKNKPLPTPPIQTHQPSADLFGWAVFGILIVFLSAQVAVMALF